MNSLKCRGAQVIDEIIKQGMFAVYDRHGKPVFGAVVVWAGNSAEQLEALVEDLATRDLVLAVDKYGSVLDERHELSRESANVLCHQMQNHGGIWSKLADHFHEAKTNTPP